MKQISVRGASDDLIEIEGDLSEEIYYDEDGQNHLAFSDGTVLNICYDGCWRINIVIPGTAEVEKQFAEGEDSENYSDRIYLKGDIDWVAGPTLIK